MKKAKIVSSVLSASLTLLAVAPVAFASDITVVGNGADSTNQANISLTRTVTIQQENNAKVNNEVSVKANTGNNEASENTGGEVSIDTGDASIKLSAYSSANSNRASVCCEEFDVSAKVSGNGADSVNRVNLNLRNDKNYYEVNNLEIKNNFRVEGNTGNNKANGNTDGDTKISTGDVLIEVLLSNKGNSNEVECDCGAGNENEGKDQDKEVPGPGVVEVIPAAAAPVGKSLPVTGFDYQIIVLGSAMITGAGALLRKGSGKLEKLLSK